MRRRRLRLFVAVRLHPGNPHCLTAAEQLRRATSAEPSLHIHWNIPSFPFSEDRGTWRRFLEGLSEEQDTVLPLGFAGVDHPILQMDELRRELDWGMRNPFDPEGLPRSRSRILLCNTPDLCRQQALELYLSRGINRIAVLSRKESLFEQSLAGTSGGLSLVRYRRLDDVMKQSPVGLWKNLRRIGESRLLVLAETEPELQGLTAFLRAISDKIHVDYGRLEEEPAWALETVDPPAGCLIPDGPARRSRAMAADRRRLGRRSNAETMEILRSLGRRTRAGSDSLDGFPPGTRDNVAHMEGAVDLAETQLIAHFQDGRIAGISRSGQAVSPHLQTLARIRVNAKDEEIPVTSAFSIEGPRLRGLRSLSANIKRGVTILQDSFYLENCPFLLTTCQITYPEGQGLEELVPVELPVARIPDGSHRFVVDALYRGGQSYTIQLPGAGGEAVSLAASLLYVPQGGLIIGTPQEKEPVVQSFRLRVAPSEEGPVLYAGLFGTYAGGGESAGAVEIFSFYLGAAEERPRDLPHLPKPVLEELPRHAVHWR